MSLKGLSLQSKKPLVAPSGIVRAIREVSGYGSSGRAVTVAANHFAMKLKLQTAYHYDVAIEPIQQEEGKKRPPPKNKGEERGVGLGVRGGGEGCTWGGGGPVQHLGLSVLEVVRLGHNGGLGGAGSAAL
jgi:hypothetical protein